IRTDYPLYRRLPKEILIPLIVFAGRSRLRSRGKEGNGDAKILYTLFKNGGAGWDLLDCSGGGERLCENAAGFEDYTECLQLGPCGLRDTNPCQTGGRTDLSRNRGRNGSQEPT